MFTPVSAQAKFCTTQANCSLIKGTTCIKEKCLCGNNDVPHNGKCDAQKQGANHLCSAETDCVENARCLLAQERNKTIFAPGEKICVCEEGLPITPTGACGGESNFLVLPGLIMIITGFSRILY
ncbi:unnamed protein product [Tenebrio molitor]|nr:unnamed protein product [Tenebrio molitor]